MGKEEFSLMEMLPIYLCIKVLNAIIYKTDEYMHTIFRFGNFDTFQYGYLIWHNRKKGIYCTLFLNSFTCRDETKNVNFWIHIFVESIF